jgi:hypothetical protein
LFPGFDGVPFAAKIIEVKSPDARVKKISTHSSTAPACLDSENI